MKKRGKKKTTQKVAPWIVAVAGILIVAIGLQQYMLWQMQQDISAELGDADWRCMRTECSRLMTKTEIAAEICAENAQGQMVCKLNVDGQEVLVPLSELDLSNVQFCAEYRCVEEVRTRLASYPVNVTR